MILTIQDPVHRCAQESTHTSDGTLAKARGACNDKSQTNQFLIEALFAPDHDTLIREVHYLVSGLLYRVAREVGQTWQVGQALANVTASILHLQVCEY